MEQSRISRHRSNAIVLSTFIVRTTSVTSSFFSIYHKESWIIYIFPAHFLSFFFFQFLEAIFCHSCATLSFSVILSVVCYTIRGVTFPHHSFFMDLTTTSIFCILLFFYLCTSSRLSSVFFLICLFKLIYSAPFLVVMRSLFIVRQPITPLFENSISFFVSFSP